MQHKKSCHTDLRVDLKNLVLSCSLPKIDQQRTGHMDAEEKFWSWPYLLNIHFLMERFHGSYLFFVNRIVTSSIFQGILLVHVLAFLIDSRIIIFICSFPHSRCISIRFYFISSQPADNSEKKSSNLSTEHGCIWAFNFQSRARHSALLSVVIYLVNVVSFCAWNYFKANRDFFFSSFQLKTWFLFCLDCRSRSLIWKPV